MTEVITDILTQKVVMEIKALDQPLVVKLTQYSMTGLNQTMFPNMKETHLSHIKSILVIWTIELQLTTIRMYIMRNHKKLTTNKDDYDLG